MYIDYDSEWKDFSSSMALTRCINTEHGTMIRERVMSTTCVERHV